MKNLKFILLGLILLGVSIHIYLINTQFKPSEVTFEEYTSDMIAYVNLREFTDYNGFTAFDYIDLYVGVIEEDGVEKLIYFYHFVEEDKGIQNSIYLEAWDCKNQRYELININNRKETIGEFDFQSIQDRCDNSNAPTLGLIYSIRTNFLHNHISSALTTLTIPYITIESVKGEKE